MAKQGFLELLKRVFEVHMQSAGVMENACAAAWNLALNGEDGCVRWSVVGVG